MNKIQKNLREELLAMLEIDQTTRTKLAASGELFNGYNAEMEAVHLKNARRLEEIIDAQGSWLGKSKVGEDGAKAAWIIAQHAISLPDFQRRILTLLKAEAATGEVPLRQPAHLQDRIAFFENCPQKYGTQSDWNERGEMQVWKLESEEKVNEYRAEVGLEPLESMIHHSKEVAENAPKDWHKRQKEFEDWARKTGWRK